MSMIETVIQGVALKFKTQQELFSPKRPDAGTLAMLSCVEFEADDRVLDLGCGYGLVGILAAHFAKPRNVFLTDIDAQAVRCATENAALNHVDSVLVKQSDGFHDFREANLTKILSNPPYHADFSIAKHFIMKGFNRLSIGGHLYMVTRRDDWYRNRLTAVFGGCKVHSIDGYYVFEAEKRVSSYARQKPRR